MLVAFLDESEQPDYHTFAVGGYIFDSADCQQFAEAWDRALNVHPLGLPKPSEVHTTDLENMREEYAHWNPDDKIALREALHPVIHCFAKMTYSVALDLDAWKSMPKEYRKVLGTTNP